jgi:hypothetical protein
MVGAHWFVHPVENGIELVINSTDGDVYDRALAEFVTHYTDYDLVAERTMEGGEVLRFVPAPAPAGQPMTSAGTGNVPAPRRDPEEADVA